MMSVIGDRHSNLRHRARFEAPLLKSIGRNFIENPIAGAFHHHRVGNFAGCGINYHHAKPASGDMGPLCLEGVLRERRADRYSFCG